MGASLRNLGILGFLIYLIPAISAKDHLVGDRSVTVTNAGIDPAGLSAGDSVTFQGSIQVSGGGGFGVFIQPVPSSLTLTFQSGSITTSVNSVGVLIAGDFDGTLINRGMITGEAPGILFGSDFFGSFLNTGTITSGSSDGVGFGDDFDGEFLNAGTIVGDLDGVYVGDDIDGGTFTNNGSIQGGEDGIDIDGDMDAVFINNGSILGLGEEGLEIEGRLRGTLTNLGMISGEDDGIDLGGPVSGSILNFGSVAGEDDGIDLENNLRPGGTITNYGTIEGRLDGLDLDASLQGAYNNYGVTLGGEFGVIVDGDLSGSIFNCGIIEGGIGGIQATTTSGTIRNHGGRIQGTNFAIGLGAMNGTVVLSGPSHIVGSIDGGTGTDRLRFENMRGISDVKKAELAALAASDPASGTIILFGETIDFQNFNDIQADSSSLVSYSSLINGPGLQNYAAALDTILGLNDDFRAFLKSLNDVDAALLNEIASNSSGQTVLNSFDDFSRQQDTRIYSLFAEHFSTLRGGVSGRPTNLAAAGQSDGLFSREVQAGGAWGEPKTAATNFVTGYVGSGDQDPTARRADAEYDATTLLFGRGSKISENWYLGAFGGYGRNDARVDRFGSVVENKVIYSGVNAQYVHGSFFANLLAFYGYHDAQTLRQDFLGNRTQGDPEGHQGGFYFQTGWDHFFGKENKGRATPYMGMALSSLSQGGFQESGSPATNLRFEDDTLSSVQSVVGLNAAGYRDTSFGWLRPRLDAAWWHAYDGASSRNVALATPGLLNSFDVFSPGANRDRAVVQVGVEFGCDSIEAWTFNAGYFGTYGGDGYSSHGGTFGAKFEF